MRSGESDGYDAVFLSPHKFLGGPDSPGVLLMNKALYLLGSSPPSTCGGGTVTYVNGFNEQVNLHSHVWNLDCIILSLYIATLIAIIRYCIEDLLEE